MGTVPEKWAQTVAALESILPDNHIISELVEEYKRKFVDGRHIQLA